MPISEKQGVYRRVLIALSAALPVIGPSLAEVRSALSRYRLVSSTDVPESDREREACRPLLEALEKMAATGDWQNPIDVLDYVQGGFSDWPDPDALLRAVANLSERG